VRHILDLVKPTAEARYAVLYTFADGGDGGRHYDTHSLSNLHHELTILANEMNGAPVSALHGAPLRLRCENEVGSKWSNGSRLLNSCMTMPIWVRVKAATTRIMNSMATACRFDFATSKIGAAIVASQ
jgi:hypothetical protein